MKLTLEIPINKEMEEMEEILKLIRHKHIDIEPYLVESLTECLSSIVKDIGGWFDDN